MTGLPWEYDDGGRAAAGFVGEAGDCVCRAIAIATGRPYREVYDELKARLNREYAHALARGKAIKRESPRNGVRRPVYEALLREWGWEWVPCVTFGSRERVHLAEGELPDEPLIARLSKHVCAVIDGVVRDNHDPTRDGGRMVYGYFHRGDTDDN